MFAKSKLTSNLLRGYATATYQIEGSVDANGQGLSIGDTFSPTPAKTDDTSNGDVATDSYCRCEQDIALLKSYGASTYRCLLSWSQIITKGGKDNPVNQAGIKYYSDLIKGLLAAGIVPFVTLFHWDLPQESQDWYGGGIECMD